MTEIRSFTQISYRIYKQSRISLIKLKADSMMHLLSLLNFLFINFLITIIEI